MSDDIFAKPRRHQKVTPVGLGQTYGTPKLVEPTLAQLQCRKSKTFQLELIRVFEEREVIAAFLGEQLRGELSFTAAK